MSGVNKTIILGRLGRDPEINYTKEGMCVCKFSMVTSRKNKAGEEITAWHRCTAFGRRAEVIAQYLSKGRQLYIEGELSYGQYEKDGHTHYTTEIIVNQIVFADSGKPKNNNAHADNAIPKPNNQPSFFDKLPEPAEDDIPF